MSKTVPNPRHQRPRRRPQRRRALLSWGQLGALLAVVLLFVSAAAAAAAWAEGVR
jgi:hypothetical protein